MSKQTSSNPLCLVAQRGIYTTKTETQWTYIYVSIVRLMQWDSWNMFEYAYTQMKGQFDWTSAGKPLFYRKWYHFLYSTCPPVSHRMMQSL